MAETHYIVDVLILLSAGIVAVLLFQRLGLGTVLGFLVAGALVGPWGLVRILRASRVGANTSQPGRGPGDVLSGRSDAEGTRDSRAHSWGAY